MPTTFQVEISASAARNIQGIHNYIAADKKGAAAKWVRQIYRKAHSLDQLPFRCEVIPEAEDIGIPYRHLIVGNYRIIYLVDEERRIVTVVHVVHGGWILEPDFFRS